jgi:hypothetical protein
MQLKADLLLHGLAEGYELLANNQPREGAQLQQHLVRCCQQWILTAKDVLLPATIP